MVFSPILLELLVYLHSFFSDGRLAVACDNGHIRLFNRKNNLIGVLKGSGQRMLTCTWAVSSATTPSTVTLEVQHLFDKLNTLKDIWGASSDGNVYGWRIRAKSMAETLPSSQVRCQIFLQATILTEPR